MSRYRSAFFAYPSDPPDLTGPITAASELVKGQPNLSVQTWPLLNIFGASIPDEVRSGIAKADVLICDITKPNLNVYYEIGYSIGQGKSIAPVLNATFANASGEVQKDGLFDIIGYKAYENSNTLAAIITDLPSTILLDLYGKSLNSSQPIYFLNAYRKSDFISAIAASIKDSKVFFRSFDPAEISRFSTVQAINDVTSSAGVIIPFLAHHVDDSPRHNIRAAFLAGLTHGLGRDALLIRHDLGGNSSSPTDFRENVVALRNEGDVSNAVIDFCKQTLISAQSIRKPSSKTSTSTLQRLTLGATAAENEFRTLEGYFVQTSEFLRTERGEVGIVAGRKGSGKTAIFFMVRDSFRQQANSVVSDLKPESHQLSLFKTELLKILDTGAFDHTLAGFWYFVILSEVLLSLKKEIEFRANRRKPDLFKQASEIDEALVRLGITDSGDFTARINRLGGYVVDEIKARSKKGQTLTPEELTNVVYRGGIADVKALIAKHAASQDFLIFLFDNIDKGWATDGVDEFDVRMVRLLLEALEKVRSDLSVMHRHFISVVFLRNDVFELLVDETPDRGKAAVVRIDWTDSAKLKQVIHRRLQASIIERAQPFNSIWARFFVSQVGKRDSFEYFVDHSLMRPRFLITIIEYAIANAINRGHGVVQSEDCVDAVRQHSNYLLNDFGYEIRDVSGVSETVLHSLVGTTKYVTKGEVLERFQKAGITDDLEKLFRYMLWYGVLGVVTTSSLEKYIYDFEYSMNRLQAEIDVQKDEPLFVTNPALHVALQS